MLRLGGASADASSGRERIEPLTQTPHREDNGELSPNGRFFAYQSTDSGRTDIYVRPFPNAGGGLWQVSVDGGTKPLWARNGRELFYLDGNDALTVVPVQTTTTFSAGTPTRLFEGAYHARAAGRTYDVSPDGQRFLMINKTDTADPTSAPATIVVVLNWFEELKARVPTK